MFMLVEVDGLGEVDQREVVVHSPNVEVGMNQNANL